MFSGQFKQTCVLFFYATDRFFLNSIDLSRIENFLITSVPPGLGSKIGITIYTYPAYVQKEMQSEEAFWRRGDCHKKKT